MEDQWSILPTTVLQQIFAQLPLKNKGRCSQICWHWYDVFNTDGVWREFTFRDYVMVRRRFTQHSGWQYQLDHMRIRQFVPMMIKKWRILNIEPVTNLFNLYEFIQKITNFTEYYEKNFEDNALCLVRRFTFRWKLLVQDQTGAGELEEKDVGTGGEILRCLRVLLSHLHGLKELEIHDLQLNNIDAQVLLQEVLDKFQLQLHRLSLLNLTLYPNSFLHLGLFLNLHSLVVSPQMISDDVIELIAAIPKLTVFKIVQDEKCSDALACSSAAWRSFKEINRSQTRIYLIMKGKPKTSLLIQPSAPVHGIIFERSCSQLTIETAQQICDNYSTTLNRFVQLGLERMKRSNFGHLRIDRAAVEIAIRCPNLALMCVRERISNGTALLLASFANQHQFRLHLRRNAMLKRVCWSRGEVQCLGYGINFDWLRRSSKDYDVTLGEIQKLTESPVTVMTDKRYKDSFLYHMFSWCT